MKKNAFTIIELMVALFILSIGISGSFILLRNISVSSSISSSYLTATFLAREGVEVIRNIRDRNYLYGHLWDTYINLAGSEEAKTLLQYNSSQFPHWGLPCGIAGFPCYLRVNPSSGFFELHRSGKFKRSITITKEDLNRDGEPDKMHIVSEVEWQERGKTFKVYAIEDLYDWYH